VQFVLLVVWFWRSLLDKSKNLNLNSLVRTDWVYFCLDL
jgi:hypothetical protein